jgi:hypothetical protein
MRSQRHEREKRTLDDLSLTFHYWPRIDALSPSWAKTVELFDILPDVIVSSMSEMLTKDLKETLQSYACGIWTATALMCFRILERELREYLKGYHGVVEKMDSLAECIKQFRSYSNNEMFLSNLTRLRKLRNRSMHGRRGFSEMEAKELLGTTLRIASWTNNYEK